MSNVKFRESDHSYWHGDERFCSVTTLLDKLSPKTDFTQTAKNTFDKFNSTNAFVLAFCKKKKIEIPEAMGMWGNLPWQPQSVTQVWADYNNIAKERGTLFHSKMETIALEKGAQKAIYNGDFKLSPNLQLLDGVYSEIILTDIFHKIAGTADLLEVSGKDFVISDYKTNKDRDKLNRKSFKGERLNSPVNHLLNCSIDKYALQLSIYAYMLEQLGYTCKELIIYWVKDIETAELETIKMPYLKKEVMNILSFYKTNNYKL